MLSKTICMKKYLERCKLIWNKDQAKFITEAKVWYLFEKDFKDVDKMFMWIGNCALGRVTLQFLVLSDSIHIVKIKLRFTCFESIYISNRQDPKYHGQCDRWTGLMLGFLYATDTICWNPRLRISWLDSGYTFYCIFLRPK